jgi:Icc-related predicted phosphoesterase
MKLLLFSDVHRNLAHAEDLVVQSARADVAVCAGDLATQRRGLQEVVDVLAGMRVPTVLVAGNGESHEELEEACRDWEEARVLHGSGTEIDGVHFWGLGGGVPVTPFGAWSWDHSEETARELLHGCPPDGVLVTHSPPHGHVDRSDGHHLGSEAVLEAVRDVAPRLVVCGHVHACWRQESHEGATRIVNAGPRGILLDL